jgi:glycosyltransferase involved in cell wall biosynthesis
VKPAIALFLPSLAGGGAERVFVDLANHFAARGLRTDLVLASARGPYRTEVDGQVRVIDLKSERLLRALPNLVGYLRRERPAAILSALDHANVVAVLARKLARVPVRCVISMRSVPSDVYARAGSLRSRVLLRFLRGTYRHADAIVANSRAVASDLGRLLESPLPPLHVIHNPIDLARVEARSREPFEHPWTAPGAPPLVLGVGSLAPLKDFATLIRAFAILRRTHASRLVLLGEGPERGKLESECRAAGVADDVLMPGFAANPFTWMRRARVVVSASVTEGFPNASLQALALGIAVVSTDAGGSPELLDGGRWGRLVPAGEPGPMAAAIAASLDAGPQADVRQRAAEFALDRIAGQFLKILLPGETPA